MFCINGLAAYLAKECPRALFSIICAEEINAETFGLTHSYKRNGNLSSSKLVMNKPFFASVAN